MGGHRKQNTPLGQVSEIADVPPAQKLLISYGVRLGRQTDLVEIQRGDVVLARDSVAAGVVAAIVVDCHRQKATHFLLGSIPPTGVYHVVPLSLINTIDEKAIWLKLTSERIDHLTRHQPDG